jgi:uncharacterized protein YbjT (DUF2867 family)
MPKLTSWAWEDQINAQSLGGVYQNLVLALQEKKVTVHAFCSLGTTIKQAGSKDKFYAVDHDLVIEFASWAKKLGASKFLYVSSMSANAGSAIFYSKVKGETENDLKALQFSYLGLFRPSLLVGTRHDFRLNEQIATFFMMPLSWLKLGKNIRPIRDHVVAKALVNVALSDSESSMDCFLSGKMQELGA